MFYGSDSAFVGATNKINELRSFFVSISTICSLFVAMSAMCHLRMKSEFESFAEPRTPNPEPRTPKL